MIWYIDIMQQLCIYEMTLMYYIYTTVMTEVNVSATVGKLNMV